MKKVLFFVIVLATMAITSQTQAQVKLGAKAGVNMSMLTEDDWTMKPGFHAGAYVQINLAQMFSIQPEFLYSMQGGKYHDSVELLFTTAISDCKITSHNLVIPIMLQFTPIKQLTIEAGPQFGFNLGTNIDYNLYNPNSVDILTTRGKINFDDYNLFDFGLAAGLKANLTPNVNVYARYVFGLTNVFKEKYHNQGEVLYPIFEELDNDMKNSNLMFGVGFSF
jgi:opacity protein-like surface antigen